MGNKSPEREVTKSIDKELNKASKTLRIAVVLLGPGGSGKTTVLKQMERIHGVKTSLPMRERGNLSTISSDPQLLQQQLLSSSSSSSSSSQSQQNQNSKEINNNNNNNSLNETKPLVNDELKSNELSNSQNFMGDEYLTPGLQQCILGDIIYQVLSDVGELCKWNVKGRQEIGRDELKMSDKSLESEVEKLAASYMANTLKEEMQLDTKMAELIEKLWKDKGFKETYEMRRIFDDMDNAPYFLDRVRLYADPNYKTTFEDYVRLRERTAAIVNSELQIEYKKQPVIVRITDVGGQRSERRKWLVAFDGANAVLWVMSLSSYDQMLFEDNQTSRYDETFQLFEDNCHQKHFAKTEFVVFLNKYDLFKKKLATIPFTKYKRDFDENKAQDPDAVIEYVRNRHEEIFTKKDNKDNKERGTLFFHVTCATDNTQIEQVIASVKFSWLKSVLEANGMI